MQDCPVHILVKADSSDEELEVKRVLLEHNHSVSQVEALCNHPVFRYLHTFIGPSLYKHLPHQRKLTEDIWTNMDKTYGQGPTCHHYNQKKMRTNLRSCLLARKLKVFSNKAIFPLGRFRSIEKVPVFCLCRMPEIDGLPMIECGICQEWFHIDVCSYKGSC